MMPERFRPFLERRTTLEPTVFDKDKDMYRRVGQYEKALASFLGQPDILQLGDEIHKQQLWMEILARSHQKDTEVIEQRRASLAHQRVGLLQEQQAMEARIATIGRSQFIAAGDFELLKSRVEVEIGHLQRRKRPVNGFLIGVYRLFGLIGDAKEVHPQIVPYHKRLAQINSESIRLGENKLQVNVEYSAQRKEQENQIQTEQERLWERMDGWAIEDSDRLLVHLLYHPERSFMVLGQYRSSHSQEEWSEMVRSLRFHQPLPVEYARFSPHTSNKVVTVKYESGGVSPSENPQAAIKDILPMGFRVNGRETVDRNQAQDALFSMMKDLALPIKQKIFGRLMKALEYWSDGLKPSDYKTFRKKDRRIDGLGQTRLRVGRYRVIVNWVRSDSGEKIPDVVTIMHRENPGYAG